MSISISEHEHIVYIIQLAHPPAAVDISLLPSMLGVIVIHDLIVAGLVAHHEVPSVPALHLSAELLEVSHLDIPHRGVELL